MKTGWSFLALPYKRAPRTLSVFVGVLEGLHQPQSLVHRSPHRKIVHGDLPQGSFVIDDEESSGRERETDQRGFLPVTFGAKSWISRNRTSECVPGPPGRLRSLLKSGA